MLTRYLPKELGPRRITVNTVAPRALDRAIVIEEGVVAMAFAYATSHEYLRDVTRLDFRLLDTITNLVSPLEVGVRPAADWEQAIFTGFTAWRQLREQNGGTIILNGADRTLTVEDC